ncbi:MAG TPA: TRAP transporter large permease subunit [Treponemataceae bacterium]|nr:TRAP transporter large permease subunit [Treponemataceae bacterium]
MRQKTLQIVGIFLLGLLAVSPLLFRLITTITGISVLSSDIVQVNLVFMFTAIAGIITSAENKQLSLGVLNEVLPIQAKKLVSPIQHVLTTSILTALFLASFSELFMIFQPNESVWGIPLRAIFGFLPLMYLGMLYIAVKKEAHKIAAFIGIIIGICIASGPIAGIVWSISGKDLLPFATTIFNFWISVSHILFWPLIILLLISAAFGIPIFIVMSGIAYIAFSQGGGYVEMIPLENYGILTDKSIAAIPLFTLAGYLLADGSAGRRLLEVVRQSVGWLRGGPVIATVVVATFFTTFTGASGVTILALGGLLTLILSGNGYPQEKAESLVTASGSIGMLFPPSLAIIIYGTTNIFSVDIFDLFKGALIPGILMALSMIGIGIYGDKNTQRTPFSPKSLLVSIKESFAEVLLPIAIFAGFFSGFFSLIETAAFTAVYAFILEVFIRKDFSLQTAGKTILKSIPVAGGVLIIIGSAKALAYFLIDAGIPFILTDLVVSFVHSKYLFLFLLNILLLVVGCIMDLYSAILVISPLIIPVAESFGIHPVHTGVIFLTNLALGFLTPPVGMNLFIASYTFEKPVMKLVKNILPYLAIQGIILMLVTYIPWFSLALL